MKLRAYRTGDAARLAEIFRAAILELGSRDYSAEQVAAWAGPYVTAERLHEKYSDGRTTFIAVDETDTAIAFSDLEADGHVDMLYCHPDHAGRGIGSALLAAIETEARKTGMARLHTEASETARPVFARAGYIALLRRRLEIDGVALHNWKMEKLL
ncbi:GNAT family N-acetyltransferase [Henriciella barbarensis]|uniref:GNAT family N-acetyltransferase n=1 Tax=Henriciella barbarensis TaxID=86342 RepID=A0A399QXG3_9PROT|nr:GNAT family N-acetyltransferase [Henriciella barbarensis]RIJ23473.1 GNAT family N-acetyltransferase [Henriciella barbarensis]